MIWLAQILQIYLEEQLLIKYIAKNPRYDEYQHGLASMIYKFFDRKTTGCAVKNDAK